MVNMPSWIMKVLMCFLPRVFLFHRWDDVDWCLLSSGSIIYLLYTQSLLLLEEQEGSVNFKFGVLYAKAGQTSDDEMFSNGSSASSLFHSFPVNRLIRLLKLIFTTFAFEALCVYFLTLNRKITRPYFLFLFLQSVGAKNLNDSWPFLGTKFDWKAGTNTGEVSTSKVP